MAIHWHVLGAGAMGCLFASALHRAGRAITLVLRDGGETGYATLRVEREDATEEVRVPVSAGGDKGPISHLLVTTKAYDVHPAVTSVAHRLDGHSQVLLLVNGMGFAEELQRDFAWLVPYHGTTTEGAYRLAPAHIRHAGRGQTRLGRPGQDDPPGWFEHWSAALDSCVWDRDIAQAQWLKLAINCAINPLTALHDCRNGELAQRPELAREVARLCREIAEISAAAGYPRIAERVQSAVDEVIAGTADNRSSMLQDILQGRRTEIDYITGHLLAVARQHGIAAPCNTALLEDVRKLDR